jgi:hypothetical protein
MRAGMRTVGALAAPLLALLAGCVSEPPPTTIELVNTTALDVTPNLYVSESVTDEGGLFVGANLITDFTDRAFPELRGGEHVALTLECDAAVTLGVDAPVLFDAVQVIATTSDDHVLLQRDAGFQCGETVRFVYFTQGDAFRVRVELP